MLRLRSPLLATLPCLVLGASLGLGPDPGAASTQAVDATRLQGLTPDAVARQVQDRDTGRDSRGEMRMRLFDRQGRVRERAMTLLTLRGAGGAGDKTLVRFLYPNDIKNTGLLVWEHSDADDERFLYLPALGRVRRIAERAEAGELRRQRPELRGHRRPRLRRLHLHVRRYRTRRGRHRTDPARKRGRWNRARRTPTPTFPAR